MLSEKQHKVSLTNVYMSLLAIWLLQLIKKATVYNGRKPCNFWLLVYSYAQSVKILNSQVIKSVVTTVLSDNLVSIKAHITVLYLLITTIRIKLRCIIELS